MEAVCLVIRAPNKKVEDFEVKCNLSWTLHKLKDHLLKNYPTKPEIECQKLIYSGKLVVGDPVLRDILVTGEDVKDWYVLHLVCDFSISQGSKSCGQDSPTAIGGSRSVPPNASTLTHETDPVKSSFEVEQTPQLERAVPTTIQRNTSTPLETPPAFNPESIDTPSSKQKIGTTPTRKQEAKATPTVKQEAKATPTVKQEAKAMPTMKQEAKATPTVKQEVKSTPTVKQEAKSTPTVKQEVKSTPTVKQEAKSTPTVKQESEGMPSLQENSHLRHQEYIHGIALGTVRNLLSFGGQSGATEDNDQMKLLRSLHPWSAAYLTYISLVAQQRSNPQSDSTTTGENGAVQNEPVVQENNPRDEVDNFAINAGIGGVGVNNGFRQDWLDLVYSLVCFMFLMFIVWTYSSLGKFTIFTFGLVILLLYQAGFFAIARNRAVRHVHLQEANNREQQPAGERPPGERPPGERPPGERPPGDQPPGDQPPGERPPGDQPPGEQPPGDQPPGERPPGEQSPPEQSIEGDDQSALEEAEERANTDGLEQEEEPANAEEGDPQIADAQQTQEQEENGPPPVEQPGVLKTLLIFIVTFFTSLVPQRGDEFVPN